MSTSPHPQTPNSHNYFSLDPFNANSATPAVLDSSSRLSSHSLSSDHSFNEVNGRNLMGDRAKITQDDESPKVQHAPGSRPYPMVERRSFRDISSTLDVDEGTGDNNGNAGSIVPGDSRGITSDLRTRSSPSPAGTIGDRRKPTPSPEDESAPLSAKTESTSSIFNMQQPISATNTASLSFDILSNRMSTLEFTVSNLSNLINTEVRSLQEEVGVLRGLVLQSASFVPAPMAQQHSNPNKRGYEMESAGSPLLVLRAASPTVANFDFTPRSSQSQQQSFLGPPLSKPSLLSNSDRISNEERARLVSLDKDEQIRSLTSQLSSISASVAHLIGTPAMSPNLSRRQPSPAVSPNLGSLGDAWNSSPVLGMGTTGSTFAAGRVTPTIRPTSSSGSVRLGSTGVGNSTFPTFPRAGGGGGILAESDRRSVMSFNQGGEGTLRRDTSGVSLN
jgi:hypothetical protein